MLRVRFQSHPDIFWRCTDGDYLIRDEAVGVVSHPRLLSGTCLLGLQCRSDSHCPTAVVSHLRLWPSTPATVWTRMLPDVSANIRLFLQYSVGHSKKHKITITPLDCRAM